MNLQTVFKSYLIELLTKIVDEDGALNGALENWQMLIKLLLKNSLSSQKQLMWMLNGSMEIMKYTTEAYTT